VSCHENRSSKVNVSGMILFLFDLNFCHKKTSSSGLCELLFSHVLDRCHWNETSKPDPDGINIFV
jgi:hypothetical protein